MLRKFRGTYEFSLQTEDGDTVTYFVEYSGVYTPARITADPYNSSPAEGELYLKDLPPELEGYEEIIREDIWNYETQ